MSSKNELKWNKLGAWSWILTLTFLSNGRITLGTEIQIEVTFE